MHRHAAVKHAHAALAVVIQLSVHHPQAAAAAGLHPGALHRHDLMGAAGAGIHPFHAVFLEKQRIPQIIRRSGEGPVGAAGRGIAVGRQPRIAVPVFEVSQLAGIDGIHRLPVYDTVFAPPQPVAALHYIIHIRHGPFHRHRVRLGRQTPGQSRHHHIIVLHRPQRKAAVEIRLPAPADGDAVSGGKANADARRIHAHAHIVHRRPAVLAVLPQGSLIAAGIRPPAPPGPRPPPDTRCIPCRRAGTGRRTPPPL